MIEKVEQWFARSGWKPFDFQRETWHAYLRGENGLVHAPTGTGKTYAVWLGPVIEGLTERAREAAPPSPIGRGPEGEDRRAAIDPTEARNRSATALTPSLSQREREKAVWPLRILWITPLRALASDTTENLRAAVDALGLEWKVELRTGDTSAAMRKKQRERLPEALVTTPESLSVMLSYPGSSDHFRNLRCVIVDEWHELMGTKRGVQTELGLARLRTLAPNLRTWGLSATLGNLDQAMRVLLGSRRENGRLVRGDNPKQIVVDTLRPEDLERFPWSGHLGIRMLPQVIQAIESARTSLLFTNVRSQAEIWFHQILKARPDLIGQVALHHGSLDRDIRTQVENLLRQGRIKAVVCTSSLDLGVDFSPVDQVMQIGSPKGIARMMQRAGRSGHQPGAVSRILGVPTNALELVEFAAARDAVNGGSHPSPFGRGAGGEGVRAAIEHPQTDIFSFSALGPHPGPPATADLRLPKGEGVAAPRVESRPPIDRPLDVLVQHMVTIASGDGFIAEQLREEVRTTHAFAQITDDEWCWCMDFVARGGAALTAYPQYSRIHEVDGRFVVASREIERFHRMAIGTITSDAAIRVQFVNGPTLGSIEESFISRLRPGDRFVFAGRVLVLVRLHQMVAQVRKAPQASGAVPKWMGGKSPLSTLLSDAIRRKLDEARDGRFDGEEMRLVRPLLELQASWSIIPAPDELLIERTTTREGHHAFVFPFEGPLVHEGLSSLVAHRLTRLQPRSVQVSSNDYGFELLSLQPMELTEHDWRRLFTTDDLVRDLLECLNTTALARRQFREIARVAGLIFPGYPGQAKSTRQLQASSEMFYEVFSQFDPQNLLLDQAKREVLDRELEVVRLRTTLERIGASRMRIIETHHLTPLGFPLWVESLRTQHVSSERWIDRIRRMAVHLEEEAAKETPKRQTAETPTSSATPTKRRKKLPISG